MTGLALPALDGRSPLGFLAALGVLNLLSDHGYPGARLSWSTRGCTATLHGAHDSLDTLANDLRRVIDGIPDGGVLPDLPTDFPPLGEAPDRLRLPRPDLRRYAAALHASAGTRAERWLSSLVTDLSVDDKGRADISLFTAPSGKQSMRTMLTKPLATVRGNPRTVLEAVNRWRRYPGVTGEYLDHRVLFDAADAPDGKSAERGVPAATWLALMAFPLFLTSSVQGGRSPAAGSTPARGRRSDASSTRCGQPHWTSTRPLPCWNIPHSPAPNQEPRPAARPRCRCSSSAPPNGSASRDARSPACSPLCVPVQRSGVDHSGEARPRVSGGHSGPARP